MGIWIFLKKMNIKISLWGGEKGKRQAETEAQRMIPWIRETFQSGAFTYVRKITFYAFALSKRKTQYFLRKYKRHKSNIFP